MGYNFTENFQQETSHYQQECLQNIAVAALLQYRKDTDGPESEAVEVKLYIAQKTVEVSGKEIRIYSWRELGFTV
jgi:hypothetical protein